MKRTGRLEVRRSIYHTWFSFFLLLLFTLTGVGLMAYGNGPLLYGAACFALLGAGLLCYALLTRFAVSRSQLAASQLAMGSSRGEIFAFFRQYALYAALPSCLLGAFAALLLLWLSPLAAEAATLTARLSLTLSGFSLPGWLMGCAAAVVLLLLAAVMACRPLLTTPVRQLLTAAPPPPRQLRQPWAAFVRLSRELPQSLSAVLAIAACTLIFVLTLSGYYFLTAAGPRQFEQLDHFQLRLDFKPGADENGVSAELNWSRFLAQRELDFLPLCSRELCWNRQPLTMLAAAGDPLLAPLLTLREAKSGQLLTLPQEGVLLSYNLAVAWQVKAGDTLTVSQADGQPLTMQVAGVFEYYLPEYLLLMSYGQYQTLFEESAEANCFYLRLEGADASRLRAQAKEQEGFVGWTPYRQQAQAAYSQRLAAWLPWGVTVAAVGALLLILVLANLNAAALRQRARELTLLRVQGFSLAEAGSGLFQDQLLRLLLGLLLGLAVALPLRPVALAACGCFGPLLLRATRIDVCLLALGVVALLGLALAIFSLLRLRHLRLTRLNQG